jgi:MFS family permease
VAIQTNPETAIIKVSGPARLITLIGLPIALFALFLALLPPVIVAMALKVNEVTANADEAAAALGLILGLGALAAMVVNPLAGRLSDRTGGRFGMRRPWIIGGVVLGYLALVIVASSTSVPMLVLGWMLAQIGFNGALAALMAIMPDQVPSHRRGIVAGAIGVSQYAALVVGTFLVQLFSVTAQQVLVPATIGVVVVILFTLVFKDRVLEHKPEGSIGVLSLLGSFVFNPRKNPDLAWAWLTRFLMYGAQATASTYLTYFLINDLGMPQAEAATGVFVATLANAAGVLSTTFIAGYFSDKLGRRKMFVLIAGVIAIIGLVVIALAPSLAIVIVGQFIIGTGMGAFAAVDLALIADVLPTDEDNGKDLGVVNIAQALPQSLVPVAAPGVIALTGGYAGLFITGAVVGLLGALSITRVRGVK